MEEPREQVRRVVDRETKATTVDVSDVINRILEENRADIVDRRIKLAIDNDLESISGNQTQIYQVFSNLISNAILHNDGDPPLISVKCLSEEPVGTHKYLVWDNGSGIAADDIPRVFEAYFRARTAGAGSGSRSSTRSSALMAARSAPTTMRAPASSSPSAISRVSEPPVVRPSQGFASQ